MDTKKNTNEIFRLAFKHLRSVRKGKLKEIAVACECSDKWLGNILNKGAGSSAELKQKIAEFYETTIEDMLVMGRDVLEGRLPVSQQVSMRDTNHSTVVNTNANEVGSVEVSIGNDQDEYTVKMSRREYEVWLIWCEIKKPETALDACLERMKGFKRLAGLSKNTYQE